ncbi:hypothetical protein Mgra_00002327, partial [Meloidogyne graminicola]
HQLRKFIHSINYISLKYFNYLIKNNKCQHLSIHINIKLVTIIFQDDNKTTIWHSSNTYKNSTIPVNRIITEREYNWSNKPIIDSYTYTKGPYIRIEQKHEGPDYRAYLEPRPALPGRNHYTKSNTNIQRKYIGSRPNL